MSTIVKVQRRTPVFLFNIPHSNKPEFIQGARCTRDLYYITRAERQWRMEKQILMKLKTENAKLNCLNEQQFSVYRGKASARYRDRKE